MHSTPDVWATMEKQQFHDEYDNCQKQKQRKKEARNANN